MFNAVNIFHQIQISTFKNIYNPEILSENINDLLCGVYLCVIWIANIFYKQITSSTESWRSHYMCFFALAMILWVCSPE